MLLKLFFLCYELFKGNVLILLLFVILVRFVNFLVFFIRVFVCFVNSFVVVFLRVYFLFVECKGLELCVECWFRLFLEEYEIFCVLDMYNLIFFLNLFVFCLKFVLRLLFDDENLKVCLVLRFFNFFGIFCFDEEFGFMLLKLLEVYFDIFLFLIRIMFFCLLGWYFCFDDLFWYFLLFFIWGWL